MSNEQNTREEFASQILRETIRFLESQRVSERNKSAIELAGTAASFLSDKSLFHTLETIWNDTPRDNHSAGKNFTAIVSNDLHLHEYKHMSKVEFEEYLQKIAPERFEVCSDSDLTLEEVLQTAKSPLDMEEIGCTFAVLGMHEKALEVTKRPELEEFRRAGIRRTIELEKLRKGDFDEIDLAGLMVNHEGIHPWNAGHIALCALGRLPYMGYPYPDW
jgi:hypothetical protein